GPGADQPLPRCRRGDDQLPVQVRRRGHGDRVQPAVPRRCPARRGQRRDHAGAQCAEPARVAEGRPQLPLRDHAGELAMTLFSGSPEGTRVLPFEEQARPFATTAKTLLALFGIGFGLRVLVFLLASAIYHIPIDHFAAKGDGASYLAYAKAILGDASTLTNYDRRVFPGYPALIALVHLTGLSFSFAALLIDWLSAGIAAALSLQLFQ